MSNVALEAKSSGLTLFRLQAMPGLNSEIGVDREKRLIKGYAVITRGEAVGHDQWIDSEFLNQLVKLGNSKSAGVKSRMSHPGLCSDGMGKYLGRSTNFRLDGNVVRADLQLSSVADQSPEGKLATYVMELADDDPESFGASIVYGRDNAAENLFASRYKSEGRFSTPDPENKKNLIHVRPLILRASDVVDDPAANPSGFFSDGSELAARGEQFLSWLFLGAGAPGGDVIGGMEPARVKTFVDGFLNRHGLSIGTFKEVAAMAEVTCPECKCKFDTEKKGDTANGVISKGTSLSKDGVIASLSADEIKKIIESRSDVQGQLHAEGREIEKKYRVEFEAVALAAGLNGDQRKAFGEYYGRDIGTVKEFAALMKSTTAKPVGEGADKPAEIPGEGQPKSEDPSAFAKKRWASEKSLRSSRGCFTDDKESAEYKAAEAKYVAAYASIAKSQDQAK